MAYRRDVPRPIDCDAVGVRVGEIVDESLKLHTDYVGGERCEASVNVPRAALSIGIG
jgi:hypothetical protein